MRKILDEKLGRFEELEKMLLDPEVAWSDKSGYKAQVEKLAVRLAPFLPPRSVRAC